MTSERRIEIWHKIRGVLSIAVVVAIVGSLGLAFVSYRQNWALPNWLVNSGLAPWLASRYGVTYKIDSLRIGYLDRISNFQIEAEGVTFDLETADPLHLELDRLYFARDGLLLIDQLNVGTRSQLHLLAARNTSMESGEVKISGVRFGDPDGALSASIAAIEFSTEELTARVRELQIPAAPVAGGPTARVAEVLTSPLIRSEQSLRLGQIDVSGVSVQIPARDASVPICEQIQSQLSAGGDIGLPVRALLEAVPALIAQLRTDLRWLSWIAVAVLLLVKLVVTIWIYWTADGAWPSRVGRHLLLGLAAVLPPVLIFALASWFLPLLWLLVVAVLASLAMAVVLRRKVYHDADFWYQRWEPFAVDATAFLILPALALQGLELPPPPDLPSAFHVDVLELADMSVAAGVERCEDAYQAKLVSPRTTISGIAASFAEDSDGGLSLAVAAIEIPKSSVALSGVTEAGADRELATVTVSDTTLHDIGATIDLENQQIEEFQAQIELSGEVASRYLRQELQRVSFFEQRAEQLARATFDLNLELRGSGETVTVADLPELESSEAQLDVQGLVGFDPEECTAQYATHSRFRSGDIDIALTADGDIEASHIRSIQSGDRSLVKVAAGSGEFSLGEQIVSQFQLHGLEAPLGSSRVSVDSTNLSATIPVSCTPSGEQRFSVATDRVTVSTTEDDESYSAKIAKATISFRRDLDAGSGETSLDTRLENLTVTGRRNAETGADPAIWLEADLPVAELKVSGRTSSEAIPREFDGEISFSLNRSTSGEAPQSADNVLAIEPPLKFTANLREGEVQVSQQQFVLKQSLNQQQPTELPFELSVDAKLGEQLSSKILIPKLALDQGPAQVSLNDLEITVEVNWVEGSPQPTVTIQSGWGQVELPAVPGSFQLTKVENLDLDTKGAINSLPLDSDSLGFSQLPQLCTGRDAPQLNPFRIEGAWPANPEKPFLSLHGESGPQIQISLPDEGDPDLRVQNASGTGLRIGHTERLLQRLSLPLARLAELELQLDVSDIRTLDRKGLLSARANLVISDESPQILTTVSGTNNIPLAGLRLNQHPERTEFALTQDVRLDQLAPALEPFLGHIGCDLSWITPTARIEHFAGEVAFQQRELVSLDADLRISPGPLVSLDFTKVPRPEENSLAENRAPPFIEKVRLAIAADDLPRSATFSFHSDLSDTTKSNATKIDASIRALRIEASDRKGNSHSAELELSVGAEGSLHSGEPPASPVVDRILAIGRDMRSHVQNAERIFGSSDDERRNDSLDLDWDFRLSNPPSRSVFELRAKNETRKEDELHLALAADVKNIRWRTTDQPDYSSLKLSGDLVVASTAHDNYLVAEGRVSAPVELSLAGESEQRFDVQLPFAIAFNDALKRAPAGQQQLWDTAHYEKLWESYPRSVDESNAVSLVDSEQLTAGPLSLRQILFPLEPLRLSVGHSKRLQLNFPFSARVLFGKAQGVLQTDVQWFDDHAAVSTSAGLSLSNFQAGALGLASRGEHIPFVEDQLSGEVSFLARDFPLSGNTMRDLMIDASRIDGFDQLDMRLQFHRSEQNKAVPGVVQVTTDTQIKALNDFLNKFIAKIRMSSPPQSVFYRDFDFYFQVEKGEILTEPLLLNIEGLELFSTERVDVGADLRVHWKREEWEAPRYWLRDFFSLLPGMLPETDDD